MGAGWVGDWFEGRQAQSGTGLREDRIEVLSEGMRGDMLTCTGLSVMFYNTLHDKNALAVI